MNPIYFKRTSSSLVNLLHVSLVWAYLFHNNNLLAGAAPAQNEWGDKTKNWNLWS